MNFEETKKELFDESQKSGKTTFSKSAFNRLTSALVNEPEYTVNVVKIKDGTVFEEAQQPIKDFRKSVIGGIAKTAGADDAEVEKMVSDYKFSPDTPWYPVMSEALVNTLESGKSFSIQPRRDLEATFTLKEVEEQIKMNGAPGAPESEKKPVLYEKHRIIKCTSTCPKHLRKDN